MSIQIKSLSNGVATPDVYKAATSDNSNVIPTANDIYDLYTAPNTSPNIRGAIVKSIRLVNTHINSVKVNLYFLRPIANNQFRRRLITPLDMVLPSGFQYIDDDEVTLEPGDRIQGKADMGSVIQYVISGMERDV